MFSQASVILFTGRGCVSQHALGQTPPGQYPSMHWGRHPQVVSQHALGKTPPRQYPSMHWGRHSQAVSQHALGQTPPDGHCSEGYASYWNAYLCVFVLTVRFQSRDFFALSPGSLKVQAIFAAFNN